MWENVSLIDDYLSDCGKKLADDHKQIIAGWKNCLQGKFVMERHLKKGTIFISLEDAEVYQIQGIISSWEEMFEWPEFTGSEIEFRKIMCLLVLNRNTEAVQYCRKWICDEPKNLLAAVAGVYALTQEKVYEEAEQLVERFILDPDDCNDDNSIMFVAASSLYEAMGKKSKKKKIDKAIQKYDEELEREAEFWEDGFDLDDISEEDLPF